MNTWYNMWDDMYDVLHDGQPFASIAEDTKE